MYVLHKCDVRNCVCPSHLWLGTYSDNVHDCIRKGRMKNGVKITEEIIDKIKDLYVRGNRHKGIRGNTKLLAKKFGVNYRLILCIVKGTHWLSNIRSSKCRILRKELTKDQLKTIRKQYVKGIPYHRGNAQILANNFCISIHTIRKVMENAHDEIRAVGHTR